jgi:hypothetical protein
MSTLTRTRRMPTQYRVRTSGVTEIRYSATPETVVVLPGTRWLEKRRERESRLAAAAAIAAASLPATSEPASSPVTDTALNAVYFTTTDFTAEPIFAQPEETHDDPSLTWTDRMRMATTRLVRRQAPQLLSLYGQDAAFELPHQD